MRRLALWTALGLGLGKAPFGPGTFGSVGGLALTVGLLATGSFTAYMAGVIALIVLSVWSCGAAEKMLGEKDPPSVVADEIAAMPLCFVGWLAWQWFGRGQWPYPHDLLHPSGLLVMGAGFVLFRLFDIFKPWPIRQSQDLPGGWGITVDDLLAALAVNLCLIPAAFLPI